MPQTVYTIGHSTHAIERFVWLLQRHNITAVGDVRSYPQSRHNPQFNRETLSIALHESDIQYVFLGKELGARSEDPQCYVDGRASYDLIAKSELFQKGIERVMTGCGRFRLALMCAEKDPLHCHRTILVSRSLVDRGVEVSHILADGSVETHDQAIARLVDSLGVVPQDMLRPYQHVVDDAYRIQGDSIAYQERERDSGRKKRAGGAR